jgi:hypothetical protein
MLQIFKIVPKFRKNRENMIDQHGNKLSNMLTNQIKLDMNTLIKGYFLSVMERVEEVAYVKKKISDLLDFDSDDIYDIFRDEVETEHVSCLPTLTLKSFLQYLDLVKSEDPG